MSRRWWTTLCICVAVSIGCENDKAPDRPGNPDRGGDDRAAVRQVDLDQLPAAVRQLVTEMRRGNAEERRAAIEALGDLKAQAIPALPELRGHLTSEDARTRIAAAKAVAQIEQARREQPLTVAEVAGSYVTRPRQDEKRPISGIWKTKESDAPVAPYRLRGAREGLTVARGFLSRVPVSINESGQAQMTVSVPDEFRNDFNGAAELELVARCELDGQRMLVTASRPLGLGQMFTLYLVLERAPLEEGQEGEPDLRAMAKLTFIGGRDMLEAAGFLVMVPQQ
ncbi:MAG: HEAT repeat domain-containing protein [Phycisphaerae bacterium]